jgi:ERCC4-type nuclease
VDTREQTPLPFHLLDPRDALPCIRGGLELGDYSAVGMEADLFIERKALPDLVGSVTHDRRRFEDELAAAASMPFRWRVLVVVGSNPSRSCEIQLETGDWRSLATGRSVRASLDAFAVRYGLTVRLCDSPLSAAAFVARTVRACARRIADARWTQRGFHARNEERRAAKEATP